MLAEVERDAVDLREVHRFPNRPVSVRNQLQWDVLSLWAGVIDGLRRAASAVERVHGIGVDSWAIDYGLLDADGRLIGNPVHYRDARTDGVAEQIARKVTAERQYAITGIHELPFNTVYQLVAARDSAAVRSADAALLIPDLFAYWLTGERVTEMTNASTTALVDAGTRMWSKELFDELELRNLFPDIAAPGRTIGPVLADVAAETGCRDAVVTAVGTHDTASAVAGVPARGSDFAFISCGTWSLVGVELDSPVTSEAARTSRFSNELGVDDTVRFLRNVMGLWLLQESLRVWERDGRPVELAQLLREAEYLPRRSIIDPDQPQFLPPGDMPARIQDECRRTDQRVPETPADITRCVLDSLAAAYQRTIARACELTGHRVEVIHLVGGGAQNALLCQLTADACGLPVVAGPVEAAAYGNVLVQARAIGALHGSLDDLRRLVPTEHTVQYRPRT